MACRWSTFSPAQPWARQDALFSPGDGETQCSKVRSDNVSDGLSLRSQAAIGPCSLSIA